MKKKLDIPGEVLEVFLLQYASVPVGMDRYKRCQEIIDKHPECFPWEHKMKNVPQEVHDAYNKEMGMDINNFLVKMPTISEGGGLMEQIRLSEEQMVKQKEEDKGKSLVQLMQEVISAMEEAEFRERACVMRERSVWNKHYGKYGIEFRPSAHQKKYI